MSRPEELEARLVRVEAEVAYLRDLVEFRAELRAQTKLIAALREAQVEHYAEHKADAAEIKLGLAHIVRLLEGLANGQH